MKVKIGPYKNWIGPYQIADLLQYIGFSEDFCHKFGERLSKTYLSNICEWIDSKKRRKINVKIDKYDIWNADYTLALIILPILKQIKEDKQGVPFVSNKDVPEELHSNDEEYFSNDSNFDLMIKKWNYVLDEMIFAFENILKPKVFSSGNIEISWKELENGNFELVKGPMDTYKLDVESQKKYEDHIQNGLILFGKYYRGLWT